MSQRSFTFMVLMSLSLLICSPAFANEENRAAIIIDDFGGDVRGVQSFLSGDIPITVAIMPFLEYSTEQANLAHEAGLEVMIHMPMEPKKGKASWLGPNAITDDLTDEEIKWRVQQAIKNVPHAKGMNNHMGSKIIENEHIMRIILTEVKKHNLYFVDSGTSPNSVVDKIATELEIPHATRHVFLDDTHSARHEVMKQMESLLKVAEQSHTAIGIGHVGIKGDQTFSGIKDALPLFEKAQTNIVPMSHILDSAIDKDPSHFWYRN